jgi:molybdate transport system ATP-binding protein
LIQRLRDDLEVPMLIVTHQPEDARALAREVLLLDNGRVQAQGPTETVLRRPEVLLRWPEWGGENQVQATVLAHDAEGGVTRVALEGGGEIAVPLLEALDPGDSVMLAVGAEEVLLATEKPQGLSARNMLETAVDEIVPVGSTIYVRAGRWFARLTPAAVAELDLAVGARVWLVVKTHSWRLVSG